MSKQLLITLTGKSGCGKSTIAERLNRRHGFVQAQSYTTRPVRKDDKNDFRTHTFITREQIKDYENDIVAYNEYNGNAYFVTRQMLAEAQIYVVDEAGLIQLYKNYHDKDILSIFIECDSSIVAKRMSERGDNDEKIMQRLQYDAEAFKNTKELCDFVIENETPNQLNDIVDWIEGLYRYYRVR